MRRFRPPLGTQVYGGPKLGRALLRSTRWDCGTGLGSAGLINLSMLFVTRDARFVGTLVNRPATTAVASVIAAIIIALNGYLIVTTITG